MLPGAREGYEVVPIRWPCSSTPTAPESDRHGGTLAVRAPFNVCVPVGFPWHRRVPHRVGDRFGGLARCNDGGGLHGTPLCTAGPISARRWARRLCTVPTRFLRVVTVGLLCFCLF